MPDRLAIRPKANKQLKENRSVISLAYVTLCIPTFN